MLKLVIGAKNYSSWSLRGWLAAMQSGLPFEEVIVPLFLDDWETRKTEPDLAVSGGKVPTLWDGGIAVWDSLAILDYLNDITGNTRFWPEDRAARALARSMAAEMHSSFVPLRTACPMNVRRVFPAQRPSEAVIGNIDRISALWEEARGRFGDGGPYLFGAFGAADIMFAPVVFRIRGYDLPVEGVARAYVEAMLHHRWMVEWAGEAEKESPVLDRYESGPDYG